MRMLRFSIALVLACPALLSAGEAMLVRNARVFDSVRMLPPTDVTIAEGHIQALGRNQPVPQAARVLDAKGKTLL